MTELERTRRMIDELNAGPSRRVMHRWIDNLEVSADAKAIISSVMDATLKIGEFVVRIGKKIVEILFETMRRYPNTMCGIALSAILALAASTIPVLGTILAPLGAAIMLVFGVADGFMDDVNNHAVLRTVRQEIRILDPLKQVSA